MLNRDVYSTDPSKRRIVNLGVAAVADDNTPEGLAVLRYELETFVCDGQYEKGIEHVLQTFLDNVKEKSGQQPGVWISGFFGSGKSHLAKMLRTLWVDARFPDGATARGIADLPVNIRDLLKELDIVGKRYGLHAAAGTLGAGATGSVRLALLNIVFKSVGLPAQYPVARFVMWLKSEGIYDQVREMVEQDGYDWQEELDNFYIAEGLHEALIQTKPTLFSSPTTCVETLNNQYPYVVDISNDEMIKAIRQALTKDNKFPLTLIVVDEVQQYIGEDSQCSMSVQEVVETCCKNIGGRILFIGTGQTAVTGTNSLKKLEGRFTVRIELSDVDVKTVIRRVILAKRPDAVQQIESVMQENLGEIARHLAATSIGHRMSDQAYFAQDYCILPVRWRFWDNTLRVLDPSGTDSQLRNQLSIIHKAIQENLDQNLGHVVRADYIYFDAADKLLQARILPRKVHEKTMTWIKGDYEDKLLARACGLIFLIGKLANLEIGIKSTVDIVADLMVEDLTQGSTALRNKLPGLLDKCELLIKVGDEYRIQTEESAAWTDDFLKYRNDLANTMHLIYAERDSRIHDKFNALVKKLTLTQGVSKVMRDIYPTFDAKLPADSTQKIYVWVRDEWSIDENSVSIEARQAGNQAPTIFVFIPKGRSAEELRHQLMDYKASSKTLQNRGTPTTPEGKEAHAYMESTKQTAEGRINEIIEESFAHARIFQSGGQEIIGNNLQQAISEAADNAVQRLYKQFKSADHSGWEKVYVQAKKGSPDALKQIGYEEDVAQNPVCKMILAFIAGGKSGTDIRSHFESPPYGWSRDSIDGALQILLVVGVLRAINEGGQVVDPRQLERKQVGKTNFKIETAIVTTPQRIQIRKLLQSLECKFNKGEEASAIPEFINKLEALASRAGGDPPKPIMPDTTILEDVRLAVGNERIIALYNVRDIVSQSIEDWQTQALRVEKKWPAWESLLTLVHYAGDLKAGVEAKQQIEAIEHGRMLLFEPDPVIPLLKSLEDNLRAELTNRHRHFCTELEQQMHGLTEDSSWTQLEAEERDLILNKCQIAEAPDVSVGTLTDLMNSLQEHPLQVWRDRTDALSGRFVRAKEMAAKMLEPETQTVVIARKVLRNEEDVDAWINETKEKILQALAIGPVVFK